MGDEPPPTSYEHGINCGRVAHVACVTTSFEVLFRMSVQLQSCNLDWHSLRLLGLDFFVQLSFCYLVSE